MNSFICAINAKIRFWNRLLLGYNLLSEFYVDTLKMTDTLVEV